MNYRLRTQSLVLADASPFRSPPISRLFGGRLRLRIRANSGRPREQHHRLHIRRQYVLAALLLRRAAGPVSGTDLRIQLVAV